MNINRSGSSSSSSRKRVTCTGSSIFFRLADVLVKTKSNKIKCCLLLVFCFLVLHMRRRGEKLSFLGEPKKEPVSVANQTTHDSLSSTKTLIASATTPTNSWSPPSNTSLFVNGVPHKFERKEGCTKDSDCRLEFVHIPKTGGTAIELAGVAANISWGTCIFNNNFWLDGKTKALCPQGREQLGRIGKQRPPHLPGYAKVNNWHLPSQYFDHPTRFANKNPYRGNAVLFAIVRNPYDRAISEYYFINDDNRGKNNKRSINHPIHNAVTMNKFLGRHLEAMMSNDTNTGAEVYNQLPLLVPGPGEERSRPTNAAYYQRDGHFIPQYDYIFDGSYRQVVHHVLHFEHLGTDFAQLMKAYGLSAVLPDPSSKKQQGQDDGKDAALVARKSKTKYLGRYNLTVENMRRIETIYARDFATFGYPTISNEFEENVDQREK